MASTASTASTASAANTASTIDHPIAVLMPKQQHQTLAFLPLPPSLFLLPILASFTLHLPGSRFHSRQQTNGANQDAKNSP